MVTGLAVHINDQYVLALKIASAGRLFACKRAMDPIDALTVYAGRGTAFLLQRIERPWENAICTHKSVHYRLWFGAT